MTYIENEFPSEVICSAMDLCNGSVPDYSFSCELCTIVYQFAYDMVYSDYTVDTLEDLLNNICDIFPDMLVNKCDSFIDKYYQKFIDEISNKYDTDYDCTAMGACEWG